MYWDFHRIDAVGAAVDVSGANATAMVVGAPIDVKRIIATVTTAITVAPAVISVQSIPLPSGVANPVALGSFSIPVAAVGETFEYELGRPDGAAEAGTHADQTIRGSVVYNADPDRPKLSPGNQLRLLSDGGPTAGGVQFFVEYAVQGFSGDRVAGVVSL